jgi:hypothetical protein
LLVIGSLIAAGATELSTFTIPETILGMARDVAALFTDATGFLVTEPSLDPRMS